MAEKEFDLTKPGPESMFVIPTDFERRLGAEGLMAAQLEVAAKSDHLQSSDKTDFDLAA